MLHLPCLAFVMAIAAAEVACGQRLHVHNAMKEGVHFWIKSEVNPDTEWMCRFIRKNTTYSIRLVSPDRFHVVVEDPQGRRFSVGLLPLKAMLEGNPEGVLKLDGIFETRAAAYLEWSPSRRAWLLRRRAQAERTAVRFLFHVNEELSYEPIIAYQVE